MISETNTEVNKDSKKAPNKGLTVNSKRFKEYLTPFNLCTPKDYRLFNADPVSYVEQIRPNVRLSLRSLVHKLSQNITTPSQRHIGNENGFTRQSVNAHFGSLEAADVMGSHSYYKQNSSYCLNGSMLDSTKHNHHRYIGFRRVLKFRTNHTDQPAAIAGQRRTIFNPGNGV